MQSLLPLLTSPSQLSSVTSMGVCGWDKPLTGQELVEAKQCGSFVLGLPDAAWTRDLAFSSRWEWGSLHLCFLPASSSWYSGEPPVETGQSFCCGAEASPAGEGQMKGLP